MSYDGFWDRDAPGGDALADALAESAGEDWKTMPEAHRETWREHARKWRQKFSQ